MVIHILNRSEERAGTNCSGGGLLGCIDAPFGVGSIDILNGNFLKIKLL